MGCTSAKTSKTAMPAPAAAERLESNQLVEDRTKVETESSAPVDGLVKERKAEDIETVTTVEDSEKCTDVVETDHAEKNECTCRGLW